MCVCVCVWVTEEEYWSDDFDDDADAQGKQQNSKPFFPNSAKHTNPPHDPPRPHTYRRYGNEPPEHKRLPSLSPAADGPIGRDDLYSGTQEVAVTGDDGGMYRDATRGYTALGGTAQNSARTPRSNKNEGFIKDPQNEQKRQNLT